MTEQSPYHAGEREVQDLAGERAIADRNGVVIGPSVARRAIGFVAKQRMLIVGTVDQTGTPWASVLVGSDGFAQSDPLGEHIDIDLTSCEQTPADILWENLRGDPRIGVLVIELASRRRLRVNGRVVEHDRSHLRVAVDEAYPNCPKYIQRRHMDGIEVRRGEGGAATISDSLGEEQVRLIRSADTLFVASVNGAGRVDASHRGGPPGFVEIVGERTLRVPDYAGNSMFNTLGNIRVHPRVGVIFLDFDRSRVLQVAGEASLYLDDADPRGVTGGTGRFWELRIELVRDWSLGVEVAWEFLDASRSSPVSQKSGESERARERESERGGAGEG